MKEKFDIDKEEIWGRITQDERMPSAKSSRARKVWTWVMIGAMVLILGLGTMYWTQQSSTRSASNEELSLGLGKVHSNSHEQGVNQEADKRYLQKELVLNRVDSNQVSTINSIKNRAKTIDYNSYNTESITSNNSEQTAYVNSTVEPRDNSESSELQDLNFVDFDAPESIIEESQSNAGKMITEGKTHKLPLQGLPKHTPGIAEADKRMIEKQDTGLAESDQRSVEVIEGNYAVESVQKTKILPQSDSNEPTSATSNTLGEEPTSSEVSDVKEQIDLNEENVMPVQKSKQLLNAIYKAELLQIAELVVPRFILNENPKVPVLFKKDTARTKWAIYLNLNRGFAYRGNEFDTERVPQPDVNPFSRILDSYQAEIGLGRRFGKWDTRLGVGLDIHQGTGSWTSVDDTTYTPDVANNTFIRKENITNHIIYQRYGNAYLTGRLGYNFDFKDWSITPSIGVKYHFLSLTNGNVFENNEKQPIPHPASNDQRMAATFGLDVSRRLSQNFSLVLGMKYETNVGYATSANLRQAITPYYLSVGGRYGF